MVIKMGWLQKSQLHKCLFLSDVFLNCTCFHHCYLKLPHTFKRIPNFTLIHNSVPTLCVNTYPNKQKKKQTNTNSKASTIYCKYIPDTQSSNSLPLSQIETNKTLSKLVKRRTCCSVVLVEFVEPRLGKNSLPLSGWICQWLKTPSAN